MRGPFTSRRRSALPVVAVALAGLLVAGCENGGETGSVGIGTVGGAALGAGAGRLLFGNSTTGMLIGAGVGGLLGNMTVDHRAEERRAEEREDEEDAAMRRELDFERQQMLQEEETRQQIEEQRLFEQWKREHARGDA